MLGVEAVPQFDLECAALPFKDFSATTGGALDSAIARKCTLKSKAPAILEVRLRLVEGGALQIELRRRSA